jgi:hypothetical protein
VPLHAWQSNDGTHAAAWVTDVSMCVVVWPLSFAGTLMDMYGNRGLDFIVEVGQRKTKPSSVSGGA